MSNNANRVLITGARAPVALHLARCLATAGHIVILADSLAFPLARATRFAQTFTRLPSARGNLQAYARAVAKACADHKVDIIIPTCEEVFSLAAARDRLGLDIPLFAPSFDCLQAVHDKFSFSQMANGFGADPVTTHLLSSPVDVKAFDAKGDWVFKPVWSRFGDRVLIKPANLSALNPTPNDPWIAQTYLPGEELCAYAIAHGGRLVALQAYRPLYRAGNGIGAGVMVEPLAEPVIEAFAHGFVQKFAWTGQIAFDFRRDASGTIHVLECNPRAVTGAHFFLPQDGLADALLSGLPATPSEQRPLGLPLAMLIYGFPHSVRSSSLRQWLEDFRKMADLLDVSYDRPTFPWQGLTLCETVVRAIAGRQSLKAAATADIEWNGEAML